jgi:undecaprenyl-diphosphatase
MDLVISIDRKVALFINSFSGHSVIFDTVMKGFANDYFMPVVFCLILVVLWFTENAGDKGALNQKAVLQAVSSLGLANLAIKFLNGLFYRTRPYAEIPVHVLLYRPGDSSLPSNAATVLFAVAMAVWLNNRKFGNILFILAAVEAFSRVYVGMHYPLDVGSGAALGIITALVTYQIFRAIDPMISYLINIAKQYFLA